MASDDEGTPIVGGPAKDKKSKQQRMMIIIGIVGLLLTYVLIKRSSSNGAAASAAAPAANTSASSVPGSDDGTTVSTSDLQAFEASNTANLQSLANGLTAIQTQVAGITPIAGSGDGDTPPVAGWDPGGQLSQLAGTSPLQTSTPTTPSPAAPPATTWTYQGSGYASSEQSVDGYAGIPNPQDAQGILAGGGSLYYASAPNVFTPVAKGTTLGANTEEFQKV